MSAEIIVAIVTGICTVTATALTVLAANRKTQAVTDVKIEELTREVREHNNFARRMPVLEEQVKSMRSDIQELKGYHKG